MPHYHCQKKLTMSEFHFFSVSKLVIRVLAKKRQRSHFHREKESLLQDSFLREIIILSAKMRLTPIFLGEDEFDELDLKSQGHGAPETSGLTVHHCQPYHKSEGC